MSKYTRNFSNTEQEKNTKNAALYIFLTIAALLILYFAGIPVLGKLTALISSMKGSNKIGVSDTTPPPPPKFKPFPAFTNVQNLTLQGNTEPGITVKLVLNGVDSEVLSDNSGTFSFNVSLENDINTFAALAVDQAGNQSQKTEDYQITFDNKEPQIEISSPSDGSTFYGSTQRQITISGKTEPEASVTINDRIISVDDEGIFQYTTTLNEGSNNFNVKSLDKAGNFVEKSLTLNFSP